MGHITRNERFLCRKTIEKQRSIEIFEWVEKNEITNLIAIDDLDLTPFLPIINFIHIKDPKIKLCSKSFQNIQLLLNM